VGAVDAAALGPFLKRNGPTATDEKNRKVFLVVIYLVGTISGKSLKLLPPAVTF